MRRAVFLSALCILMVACQLAGPSAELALGWWHKVEDLEKLEESLLLHKFQPELQDYLSAESAKESVKPWRYKGEGYIFSYFVFPSRQTSELRAVISLSERTGKLHLVVGGKGACQHEVFTQERQEQLLSLSNTIGERLNRKARFHYDAGKKC